MKFGTSGLRGLVSDMTDAVVAAHVAAYLAHLAATGAAPRTVLVGRDLRPSSPRIAAACRGAIRAAGAVAVDCGVLPTPALAQASAMRDAPAVMVTGSHIPFDRNGLKFYRAGGGEIGKDDEAGILGALGDAPDAPPEPAAETDARAVPDYLERITDFYGARRLAGLRVGLWEHSAAGRDILAEALERLGAEVVRIGRTDAFVPVDTEAVSPADAARFAGWVAEHRLDALVSTDGDGDRPLIVDGDGVMLRGDAVGALAARALGADAVATPLNASTALERSGWFDRIERTRIGSPYVIAGIEALAAAGARLPVGYEGNGGFILGADVAGRDGTRLAALPTRDALLPIVAVLAAAVEGPGSVAALAATLPARATASDRLPEVAEELSGPLLARLAQDAATRAALLGGLGAAEVDTRDGVRMTLASGDIVHLRASGNAPELRVYAETGDPETAAELVAAARTRAATMLGLPG